MAEGCVPVNLPVRWVPFKLREGVETAITQMLRDGVIEESTSVWSSPIVPVVNLTVVFVCVWTIVAVMRSHPCSGITCRRWKSYLTGQVIVVSGFHQIRVSEKCRDLTTLVAPRGSLGFGGCHWGQSVVEEVLKDCREVAGNYIDDVLVFNQDWESHLVALRHVLTCLCRAGFTVKLRKCCFGRQRLRYLGHLIGCGRLAVPEDRVVSLLRYEKPKRKRQLKSFLGVVGYYRRFVPGFAEEAALLTPMTTKEAPDSVVWTKEADRAFIHLRKSLCSCVCLHVPVAGDVFVIYTDASAVAIGGCLHVVRDEEELRIAFYSRVLKGPEVRYSTSEREALAVVCSLAHFDVYLYGQLVMVKTDHKPNLALVDGRSSSDLNPRLRRFSLKLMGQVTNMVYVPGTTLGNADGPGS